MADELSRVLNEPVVAGLASEVSYARGLVYLEDGWVGALRSSEDRVTAAVQGTHEYAVELRADGEQLRFGCSCPVGRDGVFCKHCVAVALAWLREPGPTLPTLEDARRFLGTLAPDQLVELLIDHAHEDEQLTRKLLLLTSRPPEPGRAELGGLYALIDTAFSHRGFISYREVWGWVRGIDEMIDLLEQLLGDDRAAEVIELAGHALAAAERAMDHVDDSDGEVGGVIARLERLHLEACEGATPDPVLLAERLFAWELNSPWDIFDRAAARYAGILGEAGVSRYRELAEAAWVRVPRLGPGDRSGSFDPSRFRITRIMETLAELSGDLAQQIAIRERDLSSGYRFVEIAELCREHGKDDAALEYAERGMVAFAEDPDPRLRAFARDQYRRRGRLAEAYEQSLAAFTSRPTLKTYRELAEDAKAIGDWETRHEWALAILRTSQQPPTFARHPVLHTRGLSELVRVLLWEGDLDGAWRAANEGGCTRDIWLELAERRRGEHPGDALEVYRREVEDVIARKDKRAYAEAAELIDETLRAIFNECGRATDFQAYVESVRASHKAKRNLIKALAGVAPAGTE